MLRYVALLALGVSSFVGCGDKEALAHLIQVHAVEQALERPLTLTLRGEGFPQGARGEAVLTGTLMPAGAPPQRVTLELPCRALSTSQAEVELDTEAARELREGPLEGELAVRFGAISAARVVGRLPSVTVRVGSQPSALNERFALHQRARAYQRGLGILTLELSDQGAVVGELAEGSVAANAGLRVGDVITRLDGAPVQVPADMLSARGPRGASMEVQRAGESSPHLIHTSTRGEPSAVPLLLRLICAAVSLVLGAALANVVRPGLVALVGRRELWLWAISCSSLLLLAVLLLDAVDPRLRALMGTCGGCLVLSALVVGLRRRLRPTLRTSKDPTLAPLL